MKYLFFILMLIPILSYGQSKNPCDGTTQADMNNCAYQSFDKADKLLNVTYKKLINKHEKEQKNKLIIAQRKWIEFRDAHCQHESLILGNGGSIETMIRAGCLEEQTNLRIETLKKILQNTEKP